MTPASWSLPAGARPVRLDRTDFPPGLRVLVLAPHPDDFDETGVTLRRLQERDAKITLLVCSSSANGVEDAFCRPRTEEAKAALREEEQRASLRFFGLDEGRAEFLRLATGPGGYLLDAPGSFGVLAEKAAALRPALLFLPHGRDSNPDHRLVHAWWLRLQAVLPGRPPALLFRDPKTIALREDACFPFDEAAADWKRRLLLCHHSQQARNLRTRGYGFDERILGINRDSALRLALREPYAELFEIG